MVFLLFLLTHVDFESSLNNKNPCQCKSFILLVGVAGFPAFSVGDPVDGGEYKKIQSTLSLDCFSVFRLMFNFQLTSPIKQKNPSTIVKGFSCVGVAGFPAFSVGDPVDGGEYKKIQSTLSLDCFSVFRLMFNFQLTSPVKQKNPSTIVKGFSCVGVAGFEPAAPCSQSRCANRTAPHPVCCLFF